MMTGFLAVQGIEVHAETQQTTGEAASAVEGVELEAEIIENTFHHARRRCTQRY